MESSIIVLLFILFQTLFSNYVILIAFPLQQWLPESILVLLYTYMASFVYRVYF